MFKIKSAPEQMRYKPNTFSSLFCILAIIFNVIHFIIIYSSETILPTLVIGIDVFVNIIFLLFIFLASVKTKIYQMRWAFINIGFAALQIIRIFIVPLTFNRKGEFAGFDFVFSIICLILSAVALILSAVVCYIRSKALNDYLAKIEKESV